MRTGARKVDTTTSPKTLRLMRSGPPKRPAPPLATTRAREKSLGRNRSMAVLPSRVSAHWGYQVGHTGNRVRVSGK